MSRFANLFSSKSNSSPPPFEGETEAQRWARHDESRRLLRALVDCGFLDAQVETEEQVQERRERRLQRRAEREERQKERELQACPPPQYSAECSEQEQLIMFGSSIQDKPNDESSAPSSARTSTDSCHSTPSQRQ